MSALPARIRARLREERGFTLTELLVTTLIGMITLMVIVELVDSSQNASARVTARVDGTQRGRVAMEQVTQRLRSQVCLGAVPPVVAGDEDSVSLYVDLGDEIYRPQIRRLSVQGRDLREDIFDGTGIVPDLTFGYPGTPSRTRVVLDGVLPYQATPPEPYFRYYAYNAGDPAQPSVQLATPLSAADRSRVVRIEVAFSVAGANVQDRRIDTNFKNAVTTRFANSRDPDPTRRGPQCQ